MTTEPTVEVPASPYAPSHSNKKGLIISLVVLVLLTIGITGYWMYGMKHVATNMPQQFALYENDTYSWYLLSGNEISSIDAPTGVMAGKASYPGGSTLSITEKGLEWGGEQGKSTFVLVERAGLSPETSFVSVDGTLAVLFNEVTNMHDVFKVTYEGAYVSYVGSVALPALPSYAIAGAAVGDSTIILHTGEPDTYHIYSVGDTSVTERGTATLAQ